MGKMIAKTQKGMEYCYSRSSAHSVSERGAETICKALNDAKYQISGDLIWHVYDCGIYEMNYTEAGCQSFRRRNGRIVEVREYH